jgi:hypothetical protein
VVVLVGSVVVPPIVAVALPAVASVADTPEVVGTLVAAVSVGSPLLAVVGCEVPSVAELVVLPVSGLQAAIRAAAVRRAGR